jgi:hypothetical protein
LAERIVPCRGYIIWPDMVPDNNRSPTTIHHSREFLGILFQVKGSLLKAMSS